MPIDTKHEQYEQYAEKWQRARDASAGQYAVHKQSTLYLPKLADQTTEEYNAFKLRTSFFPATGRTLDGLVGMIMRKPVMVEQNGIDELIDDIDLAGNSLSSFTQTILREVMEVYRFGVLVEYPNTNGVGKTLADKQRLNERPYATMYKTETIINWEEKRINNKMQPVLIVLEESYDASDDEYEPDLKPQLRELRLEQGNNGYYYLQRVWRKVETGGKSGWSQEGDDIIPLMNNAPLNFIPFYAFGSDENKLEIKDSVILPLADLNLAHYRVTADYENGCHFTGLPMLFLSGITLDENETVSIGSQKAVVTANEGADGKYIEFIGQGLTALENNLERKEKQMAAIGARMLEQQKSGVESEGAMQMRANGENSVLASIAMLVGDQLSNMLQFMAKWYGVASEVTVKLNTDYMPVSMTAQELTALVGAYQGGAISKETLFYNLKRGEVIAEDVDYDMEQDRIESQEPVLANE